MTSPIRPIPKYPLHLKADLDEDAEKKLKEYYQTENQSLSLSDEEVNNLSIQEEEELQKEEQTPPYQLPFYRFSGYEKEVFCHKKIMEKKNETSS